eukprot:2748171-Pyramimonas_sp.AAC.1
MRNIVVHGVPVHYEQLFRRKPTVMQGRIVDVRVFENRVHRILAVGVVGVRVRALVEAVDALRVHVLVGLDVPNVIVGQGPVEAGL